MIIEPPSDRLDDPKYLRAEAARIREMVEIVADPAEKMALAAHSLDLAQRAEAIGRRPGRSEGQQDRRLRAYQPTPVLP